MDTDTSGSSCYLTECESLVGLYDKSITHSCCITVGVPNWYYMILSELNRTIIIKLRSFVDLCVLRTRTRSGILMFHVILSALALLSKIAINLLLL